MALTASSASATWPLPLPLPLIVAATGGAAAGATAAAAGAATATPIAAALTRASASIAIWWPVSHLECPAHVRPETSSHVRAPAMPVFRLFWSSPGRPAMLTLATSHEAMPPAMALM